MQQTNKQNFEARLADVIIWSLMLVLFIYNAFFQPITNKTVWGIAVFLMIISLIIKIKYNKKELIKETKDLRKKLINMAKKSKKIYQR